MWSIRGAVMQRASTVLAAPATAGAALAELSVVIPAHDEQAAIADVVAAAAGAAARVAGRWEVVVVDDGSTDGTGDILSAIAQRNPRTRIVRHARNRGYGAALRTGFAAARYGWCFVIDGDGQLDPAELPAAVAALDGADGVIGYRRRRADPAFRRVNTWLWNAAARTALGVRARDVNCAFKLLPRDAVAPERLTSAGAAISAEILARAARMGLRFVEIPVTHRPRRGGRPSGARPAVVARAAWELPRLCWRLRREAAA